MTKRKKKNLILWFFSYLKLFLYFLYTSHILLYENFLTIRYSVTKIQLLFENYKLTEYRLRTVLFGLNHSNQKNSNNSLHLCYLLVHVLNKLQIQYIFCFYQFSIQERMSNNDLPTLSTYFVWTKFCWIPGPHQKYFCLSPICLSKQG